MKVLISKKTGNYYYYNENGDYHCKEGVIKEEDLKSDEKLVKANTNREFIKFDSNLYDMLQKIKRGPQIITPKDLGYIASRTMLNKTSNIIEAGGGSGAATLFFSGIANKVKTYEIKSEHCRIIQKNLNSFNVENVELIEGDLAEIIENEPENSADLIFLDMPDPNFILDKDLKALKSGQYIVCYVPSITQIQEIVNLVSQKDNLYFEEISEVILRHWKVSDRIARPEHRKEIDHTAFLVFIRKI